MTKAFSGNTVAGNTIVICCYSNDEPINNVTSADSGTVTTRFEQENAGCRIRVSDIINAGGGNTCTVTLETGGTNMGIIMLELSFTTDPGAYDTGNTGVTASTSTPATSNATPTTTESIAVGVCGGPLGGASAFTPGTGWTEQAELSTNIDFEVETKILSTTDALAADWTQTNALAWTVIIGVWKSGGAAAADILMQMMAHHGD
jgi:hypothetical protein